MKRLDTSVRLRDSGDLPYSAIVRGQQFLRPRILKADPARRDGYFVC